MSEKIDLTNNEVQDKAITEIADFETLNTETVEKSSTNASSTKTTTKGLRITERTKERFNQAEKASGLSQDGFTNRLLDICERFDMDDLTKNPEFIELTSIVNRIPEIYSSLLSKQKTYENGLISKYSNEIESLNNQCDELVNKYEELKKSSEEKTNTLTISFDKLKAESELTIREQEREIEKITKENKEKEDQLLKVKKNLEITKESLDNIKLEQFKNLEKINSKTEEVNTLNSNVQEIQKELIDIKQEKLNVEARVIEHQQQIDYYKMKLENAETQLAQQKEMYEERINHYKSIMENNK